MCLRKLQFTLKEEVKTSQQHLMQITLKREQRRSAFTFQSWQSSKSGQLRPVDHCCNCFLHNEQNPLKGLWQQDVVWICCGVFKVPESFHFWQRADGTACWSNKQTCYTWTKHLHVVKNDIKVRENIFLKQLWSFIIKPVSLKDFFCLITLLDFISMQQEHKWQMQYTTNSQGD